jgi:hypothetical protein
MPESGQVCEFKSIDALVWSGSLATGHPCGWRGRSGPPLPHPVADVFRAEPVDFAIPSRLFLMELTASLQWVKEWRWAHLGD